MERRESEEDRLRRVLAGVALRRWKNRSMGQAWAKWGYEVRRTRIVSKAIMRWQHRMMSQSFQALGHFRRYMLMNKQRVLAIVARCVGRWRHRIRARAWYQWYEQHKAMERLRNMASKAKRMWKNTLMAKGWRSWYENLESVKRTRAFTTRAVLRWKNRLVSRALDKWHGEVARTKRLRALAGRAIHRWKNHLLSQGWRTWYEEHVRIVRMTNLTAKTVQRWLNTLLSKALAKWRSEVIRARKTRKAVTMWRNRALGRAWKTWRFRVVEKTKSLKRAMLYRLMTKSWESWLEHCGFFCTSAKVMQADVEEFGMLADHEQDEKEREAKEGGFVGLQVTEVPPHFVKQVSDLVDRNFIRQDQPGYSNPKIVPGDRILQVNGTDAEHVTLEALQSMLKGPLHSTVLLSLARAVTGARYSVEALRHGKHSFDGPNGATTLSASAADLYNTQRISGSDIYNSQRSTGSVSCKSPVHFRADATGHPPTSQGSREGRRKLTPQGETNSMVASNKALTKSPPHDANDSTQWPLFTMATTSPRSMTSAGRHIREV